MDIEKLLSDKSKKVGLVMAHADDEVLFASGLLSKYAGSNWKLITCFLLYDCGDSDWRECLPRLNSCSSVCNHLNIEWHFLSFPCSRWNKRKV